MNKISVRIVADSLSPKGERLTTYILTYPRFIHAEVMTHRVFSRNTASSRAIPFNKMLKLIQEDPFIPIAWQLDHKGMQGTEYFDVIKEIEVQNRKWIQGRDAAVVIAKRLHENNVTKQLCNRLLEPFMWHTALVTATEWDNFFELRCPKYTYKVDSYYSRKDLISSYTFATGFEEDKKFLSSLSDLDWIKMSTSGAEIHIQALAEAMWDAMNESTPKQLKAGEWHIPFGDRLDDDYILQILAKEEEIKHLDSAYDIYQYYAVRIAIARCARLSYMTFDGEIDYEKDIKLFDHLYQSKHMSPFEHVARCMTDIEYSNFYKGYINDSDAFHISRGDIVPNSGWCNNFKGFIQYRYLLENGEPI